MDTPTWSALEPVAPLEVVTRREGTAHSWAVDFDELYLFRRDLSQLADSVGMSLYAVLTTDRYTARGPLVEVLAAPRPDKVSSLTVIGRRRGPAAPPPDVDAAEGPEYRLDIRISTEHDPVCRYEVEGPDPSWVRRADRMLRAWVTDREGLPSISRSMLAWVWALLMFFIVVFGCIVALGGNFPPDDAVVGALMLSVVAGVPLGMWCKRQPLVDARGGRVLRTRRGWPTLVTLLLLTGGGLFWLLHLQVRSTYESGGF